MKTYQKLLELKCDVDLHPVSHPGAEDSGVDERKGVGCIHSTDPNTTAKFLKIKLEPQSTEGMLELVI